MRNLTVNHYVPKAVRCSVYVHKLLFSADEQVNTTYVQYVNVVANDAGYFKEELTPVTVMVKRKEVMVDVDEHPKPQTTLENLAKLPTVFKKDGVVTAGSSSVSRMLRK